MFVSLAAPSGFPGHGASVLPKITDQHFGNLFSHGLVQRASRFFHTTRYQKWEVPATPGLTLPV